MFIPDPDFYPSRILVPGSRISNPRIPDPKTATKERGEKKCCHTFFCSHEFQKIVNYFIFKMLKKKIRANFQRIIELFTQKIVTKLSKIWVGIRVRDTGSRIQGSKRHWITDPGSRSATLVKFFHLRTFLSIVKKTRVLLRPCSQPIQ